MESAMNTRIRTTLLAAGMAVCGCSSESEGEGDVAVRISGQDFVKSGWPVMDGDERVEFYDGWAVKFDHVVVGIEAFRVAEGKSEHLSGEPRSLLVDVRTGDHALWTLSGVGAQRYTDVGYRFAPPGADSEVVGELPAELAQAMRDQKLALWIEGTGEKAGRVVRFQLGIPGEVTVTRCHNGRDDTDGIVVGEGRTEEVEVTLHMDHLFWDDHDAEEPHLLFGPLAHAAGDDDLVTLEELASQRLADMKGEDGQPLLDAEGAPIVFVPRIDLPDDNLREFMVDTALTLGHFNGEGHCSYEVSVK
jgi:hypothetical protein